MANLLVKRLEMLSFALHGNTTENSKTVTEIFPRFLMITIMNYDDKVYNHESFKI